MNATEDGDESMGESPDLPARYDAGMTTVLDAIDRGAVLGILSAADAVLATKQLAERQTQGINAVRALHQTYYRTATITKYCVHCSLGSPRDVPSPCPTIRALDEAGA